MPEICVIVCTFNRCNYLPRLFESLKIQALPKERFEILIIDNNSNDDTGKVVRGMQESIANLKYVFESRQGLSIARNRGLSETESPIVVYIDDDAYAAPKWLASYIEAFKKNNKIVCAGGPVELDWQGKRPDWIPSRYEPLFTSVDYGTEERYLTRSNYLVGANIGFRRDWLREQGGFPEDLGRKGNCLISGEEASVYKTVFESGNKAFYHPYAKVWHIVTAERRMKKWFFRRLFWDGATQPILDSGVGQKRNIYLKCAYVDLRRCVRFSLDSVKAVGRLNGDAFTDAACRLDQRLGRLYMHLRLSLRARP
jgi:glycosyltransferase involved in cell wall biosynthesis